MLSDHAAQNLRTTSIGLSIWLLLWSSFDEGTGCAASRRAAGGLQFAIRGEAPAARVCCGGELSEIRHGWPTGVTRGRLIGIRWRPARLRKIDGRGSAVDGYGPGTELRNTEECPAKAQTSGHWSFGHWSLRCGSGLDTAPPLRCDLRPLSSDAQPGAATARNAPRTTGQAADNGSMTSK